MEPKKKSTQTKAAAAIAASTERVTGSKATTVAGSRLNNSAAAQNTDGETQIDESRKNHLGR